MMCFGVAFVVSSLGEIRSNIYFGDASKKLINTTISRLEAGDSARLLTDLKELKSEYKPTYETRSRYKELVETFADQNNSKQ